MELLGFRLKNSSPLLKDFMSENKTNKFIWGETVRIKRFAPMHLKPGQIGSICGMREASSIESAKENMCQIGDWIYTVEYIGGTENEIAESFLEKYPDSLKYITTEKVVMKPCVPSKCHPSEVVKVVDFHIISEASLAKNFHLKIGDPVYVLQTMNGEEFLAPESYIDEGKD
jgi:hypothetical protein